MQRRFTVDASAPLVRPRRAGGTTVRIESFAFAPQTLRTAVGTTVRWTNGDAAQHTVTSTRNGPLSSTVLGKGKGYAYRFRRAGTFAYFCEIHPSMKGRVVVARP
jgi:plastocyanin